MLMPSIFGEIYLMISLHRSITMTKMRRKQRRSCMDTEHRIL